MAMATKKIGIETKEQRDLRLKLAALRGDPSLQAEARAAVEEDWEGIRELFKHYQVDETSAIDSQLFQLCIEMGRKLHPKNPSAGRPKLWTDETKGLLVVEMERLQHKNPRMSTSQLTKILSKVKPWNTFIKVNSSTGDRAEVIKQQFYAAKDEKSTKKIRQLYAHLRQIDSEDLWEQILALLEKTSVKKDNVYLITSFISTISSNKI